jgi:hypothetical protein
MVFCESGLWQRSRERRGLSKTGWVRCGIDLALPEKTAFGSRSCLDVHGIARIPARRLSTQGGRMYACTAMTPIRWQAHESCVQRPAWLVVFHWNDARRLQWEIRRRARCWRQERRRSSSLDKFGMRLSVLDELILMVSLSNREQDRLSAAI